MQNLSEEHGSSTNSKPMKQRTDQGSIGGHVNGNVREDKELSVCVVVFAQKNRGSALKASEQLYTLLLQPHLQYEHKEQLEKVGTGRRLTDPAKRKRIAQMLRRKEALLKNI